MKLIGLCGYARAGKDEAAKALVSIGWKRVALADALKSEICQTFGVKLSVLEKDKEIWRPLLVEWGRTRRRMDPAYWIKKVLPDIAESVGTGVVITDIRYWNEAKMVAEKCGTIVRMHRPGISAANEEEATTISMIDGADKILGVERIDNDGSIADLHRSLLLVAKDL